MIPKYVVMIYTKPCRQKNDKDQLWQHYCVTKMWLHGEFRYLCQVSRSHKMSVPQFYADQASTDQTFTCQVRTDQNIYLSNHWDICHHWLFHRSRKIHTLACQSLYKSRLLHFESWGSIIIDWFHRLIKIQALACQSWYKPRHFILSNIHKHE